MQKAALPVLDWRLLQTIAYVHESARARARTQVCYVCVCVRAFTEVGYSYHTRICGSETQTANPCSGNANTTLIDHMNTSWAMRIVMSWGLPSRLWDVGH